MKEDKDTTIPISAKNWKIISNMKINLRKTTLDDVLTTLIECYQKHGDKQ